MKQSDLSRCDRLKVIALLQDRLSESEQAELEQHLNQCEECQSFLQKEYATEAIGDKAGEFLRDDDWELVPISNSLPVDFEAEQQPTVISQVLSALAPSDDPEMLGRVGGYEIIGAVGYGGMGVVLKGYDTALKRVVAIKVLAPYLASSEAARRRFAREAQAAAAVTHDNVVQIYSVDEAQGLPYLVMPFSRGPSLQKRIDQRGALEVVEVLRIGFQIASGLAAFHKQGLVHRDIKPANILLSEQVDRLMITDFGLARAVDDATLTKTGVIAGTPQFMSPEQASGKSVDARSDLFSLGSLLYVLCTGQPPFVGDSSYGILRQVTDAVPRPINALNPRIPAWLCRIVEKLQAKSPAARYQSADDVAQLLQQCLAHVQHPTAVPLPHAKLPRRSPISHAAFSWSLAAIIIMAASAWLMSIAFEKYRRLSTSGPRSNQLGEQVDPADRAGIKPPADPAATNEKPVVAAPRTETVTGWEGLDEAQSQQIAERHMKALVMAIHAYAEAHDNQLPPPILPHAELPEQRRLSGLVCLLPYFDCKPSYLSDESWEQIRLAPEDCALARQVYESIDPTKAWDDAANATAARTLLPIFLTPGVPTLRDENGFAVSHFAMVRGFATRENGAFPADGEVFLYHPDAAHHQIPDGSSATLAVGQIASQLGPWIAAGGSTSRFVTHPHDGDDLPGFGSQFDDACIFSNCDGRVIFLDLAGSTSLGLQSLVTRAGGMAIKPREMFASTPPRLNGRRVVAPKSLK